MSESKQQRKVVVINPQGLHLRPAELLIRRAREFDSTIEIILENHRAECNSIISIVALGAVQGTELLLEAQGTDAAEALETLAEMFSNGFDEMESSQPEE